MAKNKLVLTWDLLPGMKAAQDIRSSSGQDLLAKGTTLDGSLIERLKKLGITSVYIEENDVTEAPIPLSELALQQAVEKYRVPDPPTVQLSDSVRTQVNEGVQFIYNNVRSPEMTITASDITDTLLNVIESNDAVAVDISALRTSDEYTFRHSVDVATISMILAKHLNFSQQEMHDIGLCGLLHDIGKADIPSTILNKPGRLTDEEFEIMKEHPVRGYHTLLGHHQFSQEILLGVLQHHEKMNGSGYPLHLVANQIGKFAKLITVADIYDALVTDRPYKAAYSPREAVEMLMAMTEELDMASLHAFMQTMILYPEGSKVKLSNGEDARVLRNDPKFLLRPMVLGLSSGHVYNLGEDLSCASLIII